MYGMFRTKRVKEEPPPLPTCIKDFIELTNMKYNINHRLLSFLLKVAERLGIGNPHVTKQGKPGAPLQGVVQRPECKDTTPAFITATVVFCKIKLVLMHLVFNIIQLFSCCTVYVCTRGGGITHIKVHVGVYCTRLKILIFNPILHGLFQAGSTGGGGKKCPQPFSLNWLKLLQSQLGILTN